MKPTRLADIAAWCGGTVAPQWENLTVNSFCHDTRELKTGALFFALTGASDGHDYIPAAKQQGAVAAVVSREGDYPIASVHVKDTRKALQDAAKGYRSSLSCKVVGVTGSVGKTTTRSMIAELLAAKYITHCTVKNYNNDIGLPVTIGMCPPDAQMMVLEMGMNHRGEISVLTAIGRPDIAVITNIGSMHIENLGSREGILQAKLEILEGLNPEGTAVFNGDEPMLWDLRESMRHRTRYFALDNEEADVRAEDIRLGDGCSSFTAIAGERRFPVELQVGGLHNIYDALAAITVALECDVPVEDIQAKLAGFVNRNQRQRVLHESGYILIDDTYNAGPESTEAALRLLDSTAGSAEGYHRFAVLGDMLELGDHANGAHFRIGRIACNHADYLLTYGPLSGSTVRGAVTGGMSQKKTMNFATQEELLNVLLSRAKPGDVLLFKGSHGMHMEKVLADFIAAVRERA